VHHSFPDPAKATGTKEEITEVFRSVRDAIERDISQLLDQFER
jgi:arsenate reductase